METPSTAERRLAYTLEEAKTLTTLSRTTLWRARKAGKLRTTEHGRRRLILADELEAFIRPAEKTG